MTEKQITDDPSLDPSLIAIGKAIQKLPNSANEIATFLEEKGFQGIPTEPDSCPIARYLKQVIGQGDEICVNNREALILRSKGPYFRLSYGLPSHVTTFIELFDDGAYPQLNIEKD